ncbi:MAG TPA: transcription elongation factor GreB, partial [Deltaproteobacteria bacterium]|nr:transcription elongation factor GreB [Deltaproteobacteria bacterium]
MTPAGAARLKSELQVLLYEQRPKLTEVVAWAAGNGDRSENADYIYGKRKLREID